MQITSKGQVTIPQAIRNRLGLLPHTEVEWEIVGDNARIRKADRQEDMNQRMEEALAALWGSADKKLTADEVMGLMRGPSADVELADKPR